jgi:hypothetical protein
MLEVSTLTIKPLMNLSDLEPTIYHAMVDCRFIRGFIVSMLTLSMVDCRFIRGFIVSMLQSTMLEVSTLTIKPLMNLSDIEPTIYHARGEHTNNKTTDEPWNQ